MTLLGVGHPATIRTPRRPSLGARDGPIALSVLILVVVLATALPVAAGYRIDAAYAITTKVVLCALTVLLLSRLAWWGRCGFLALPARRDLAWLAAPSLLVVAALVATVAAGPVPMEPVLILAFALVALGTGFSEEGLFRGVLLESLRPWGRAWAIVGTTAVFSSIHLAGLLGGATIEATLVQVLLGGVPFGLAFAGFRLWTRSIWPLVLLHAVNNFSGYLTSGHWEAVAADTTRFAVAGLLQLGLIVTLAACGAWFVWRSTREARSPKVG